MDRCRRGRCRAAAACLAAVLLLPGEPLSAQAAAESPPVTPADPAGSAIQQKIEGLAQAAELDEALRNTAIGAYRQALASRQRAQENQAEERELDALIATGREQVDATRQRAESLEARDPEDIELPAANGSRELLPVLEQARAEAANVTSELEKIRRELASLTGRPPQIREEIAREQDRIESLQDRLQANGADATLHPEVRAAMTESLQAQIAAAESTVSRLQKALLANPIQVELLQARRREAAARLRLVEARAVALDAMLAQLQRSEALAAISDAGVDIPPEAAADPAVQALRQENLETARALSELTERSEQARQDRDRAQERTEEIGAAFEEARRKLEVAGSNQVIGRILLEERRALPNLPDYRARLAQREQTVREAGIAALEREDELRSLRDPGAYLAGRLAGEKPPPVVMDTLERLVAGRRALLDQLTEASSRYVRRISELDFQERELLRTAQQFDAFLAQRLLGIRTREAFGLEALRGLPADLRAFLDPGWWAQGARGFARALATPAGVVALLLLAALPLIRRRARAVVQAGAQGVGKASVDDFARTVRTLLASLAMAAPLPLALWLLGRAMTHLPLGGGAAHSLGTALTAVAPVAFILAALRAIAVPGGLAQVHFRYAEDALRKLRRHLRLLWPTFLLPGFLLVATGDRGDEVARGEATRVLIVLLLLGLSHFLYRLLHPRTGLGLALKSRTGAASEARRGWLWTLLALVIPAALLGATLLGYVYSAGALLRGLISTLALLLALVLLQEMIYRWLLVARRRIQLQEILKRREAAQAARAAENAEDETDAVRPSAETEVDLQSLDLDTRKLVRVALVLAGAGGLFLIWSELLPALSFLDDLTLWRTSAGTGPDEALRPVSLADLLLAVLIGFLTLIGARTVPSVIEIILRQREAVAFGSRVAFATLTRYAIVFLGAIVALGLLGASWSKLQWLAAALGVGIGFGLQEIVANFISGLIILVERPIRVGDVVTVGDVEGKVTRIQIRATTVTNWNKQEFLVPNREFITGRVLNWSLSDEVTRIIIPVGVAYGSDVERALELLLECGREHPAVLEEPAPFTGFYSFGDNALGLELRVYVGRIGDLLSTKTDLHLAIDRRFREAGIEISFPQRDVHLDTLKPLEVTLQRAPREERGGDAAPGPA